MDRCRVWESHADPEVRRISKPMQEPAYPTYVVKQSEYETELVRVVTVNKPNSLVDQSEELLKQLLAVLTPTVSPPARAPELSPMDKLVQLLLSETAKENRSLRRRSSLRSWKHCFKRTSQSNNCRDRSSDSGRYDVAGLT